MTSAFYPTSPIKLPPSEFNEGFPHLSSCGQETDVGETEDEEVKINCMHGVDRDSDLSFADSSDEDRDDDEDEEESVADPSENMGVVHFVSGRVQESVEGIQIIRPRAERFFGESSRLPSHHEETELESDSESSASRESVGARGVGISLGTPTSKMTTDGSPSDGDESSISDDEDDSLCEDNEHFEVGDEEDPDPSNLVLEATYPSDEDVEYTDQDLSNFPELLDGPVSDVSNLQSIQDSVPILQDEDVDTNRGVVFLIPQESAVDLANGVTQVKRPLSSCSFEELFLDDCDASPKRRRSSEDLPFMPILTLGPSALPQGSLQMRQQGSPISTSDEDDEEDMDKRLSEELDPEARVPSRENTPVPLLTPPASPLTIELGGGTTATVCEWPSNLAVDSALTAASILRPMSPESLEQLELDEEQRVGCLIKGVEASTLTPLLRSIYVGIE